MTARARLDVSRMSERQLNDKLWGLLIELSNYGFTSLTASQVRANAHQATEIALELRQRRAQGSMTLL